MRSQRLVITLVLLCGSLLVTLAVVLTMGDGGSSPPGSSGTETGAGSTTAEEPVATGSDVDPRDSPEARREEMTRRSSAQADPPAADSRDGRVTGRVETMFGKPLAGARVEVATTSGRRRSIEPSHETTTDAKGRFSVILPGAAWLTITARAEGYVPQTQYGVAVGDDVIFVLEQGALLAGIVVDDQSGFPVSEARVSARVGPSRVRCRTGADGRFELASVSAGAVSVQVIASGYERGEFRNLAVGQSSISPAELRVQPGRMLAGVVVDDASGTQIVGATATYSLGAQGWSMMRRPDPDGIRLVEVSDASGGFVFERVGLDDAVLRVEAVGYATRELRAQALADLEEGTTLEVRLVGAVSLEGIIRAPSGEPVSGAEVHRSHPWSDPITAGTDGRFVIDGLDPSDKIQLTATHPSFAPAEPAAFRVEEAPRPLELVLAAPASIVGQVLGPEGRPQQGARVTLRGLRRTSRWTGPAQPLVLTGEDGRFAYGGLTAGDYLITARGERCLGDAIQVRVAAGEEHQVVVSTVPALAVSGRVTDSAGRPLGGVRLDAMERRSAAISGSRDLKGIGYGASGPPGGGVIESRRPAVAETYRTRTFSDDEGLFVLQGFARDANVRINAHRAGYTSTRIEAVAGTVDVVIVVERFVTFEGRVVDAATRRPIPSFTIELARERNGSPRSRSVAGRRDSLSGARLRGNRPFTNPEGLFVLDRLVPGSYRIRARSPDHRVGDWTRIDVVSLGGSALQVTLSLLPASIVKGRVLTVDGQPARRVSIFLEPKPSGGAKTPRRRAPRVQTARTDDRGIFRFREMRPGPYDLGVGSPGDPVAGPLAVTALEGVIVERELRLPPLPTLEVQVIDEEGQPVERASVRARRENGARLYLSARTNGSGLARFENLLPGSYKVSSYSRQGRSQERVISVAGVGSFHEELLVTRRPNR